MGNLSLKRCPPEREPKIYRQKQHENGCQIRGASHITNFLFLPGSHWFLSDGDQELSEDECAVEVGNTLLEIQQVVKTLTGDDRKGKR